MLHDQLHDQGYALIEGLFSKEDISSLSSLHDEFFPSYDTGETKFGKLERTNPLYQSVYFNNKTKTRFDGIPLKHRIFRGQGSPNLQETPNLLFGKRASRSFINLDERYDRYIFDNRIIDQLKVALGADSINFLQASANRVYPGYTGEDGIFHIDTYGFTGGNNTFRDSYFMNIIIFINGATKDRSGTQIIPRSYCLYKKLNTEIARSIGKNDKKNVIHQREAYYEFFDKKTLESRHYVDARPGDVLIFRSDVFHCIPGNNTELHRDAIIANFSASNEFFKSYSKNESDQICSRVEKHQSVKFRGRSRVQAIRNKFEKSLSKAPNLVRSLISLVPRLKFKNFLNDGQNKAFRGLNLGSGPTFECANFIKLDVDESVNKYGVRNTPRLDINHDLSSPSPLPIEESSIDCIYTSHALEHLTLSQVKHVLNESHRVLKPGGVMRIVVPDFSLYHNNYLARNLSFFNWIRNKNVYRHDSWPRFIFREIAGQIVDAHPDTYLRECLETKTSDRILEEFNTLSDSCHDISSNIPDIHKCGYSHENLTKLLESSKFKSISPSKRHQSRFPAMRNASIFDNTRPHISLYIEAEK